MIRKIDLMHKLFGEIPGNAIAVSTRFNAKEHEVKEAPRDKFSEIVRLVGQYLVDNAEDLLPIEYSDLEDNDIYIHLKRRKKL